MKGKGPVIEQAHVQAQVLNSEQYENIDLKPDSDESDKEENTTIVPIGYCEAFEHMLITAGPFTLANLSLAAYTIGNGLVLSKIGHAAVASGPLLSTFAYSIFSTVNGILYATGIFVGNLNGASKLNPEKNLEIGGLIRRSWIIGSLLSIPSLVLLLNSGALLRASGIDADVSQAVQDYFKGISYGIVPIFWNFSDQQLTLGLNRQKVTLISGTAYSVMAAFFGYPLALGLFGLHGRYRLWCFHFRTNLSGFFKGVFSTEFRLSKIWFI